MNLLIYAPQMAAYGGMERHLCLVAEAMAATGAHVTLLTTSNSLAAAWRDRLRGAFDLDRHRVQALHYAQRQP